MKFSSDTPLVFLDTETTGMHNNRNRIIEIAAVRVEKGVETASLVTFLDPGQDVPAFITGITGITSEDLRGAPRFEDIVDSLIEILDGAVLVAHNARFDHAFLQSEFARAGRTLRVPTLCTVRMSRRLFPDQARHRLDELAMAAGVGFERRHRAEDDTRALIAWWRFAEAQHGIERLLAVSHAIVASPSLPTGIASEDLEALPNGPGVYLLYGEDDELLYVGKSVRVRERVRSHFTQDYTTGKELTLTSRTRRIAFEETAGDLGALLRESQLIKERQPTYNAMLRHAKTIVALEKSEDASGYHRLALRRVANLDPETMGRIVGFARTIGTAREKLDTLVRVHGLCQTLCSKEKLTGRPCFARELGWCRGACTGFEDCASYNARVALLCAETGMRVWPHPGPVTITERHPSGTFSDEFVIEHWAVIARRRISHAEESCEIEEYEPRLDLDAFKIISKALMRR